MTSKKKIFRAAVVEARATGAHGRELADALETNATVDGTAAVANLSKDVTIILGDVFRKDHERPAAARASRSRTAKEVKKYWLKRYQELRADNVSPHSARESLLAEMEKIRTGDISAPDINARPRGRTWANENLK